METPNDPMIAPCSAKLTDKAVTHAGKAYADTSNTSLMCQLSGPMCHSSTSSLHTMGNKPMALSSLDDAANQPFHYTFCTGASRMIPWILPPLASPIFSTATVRGIAFSNKGPLGSAPLLCGNDMRRTHTWQREFDVQLSDICQRRFVMFDHSGSKRRMIFHPAMATQLSTLIAPSRLVVAPYTLEPSTRQGGGSEEANSPFSACMAQAVVSSPCNETDQGPVYGAMDSLTSASDDWDVPASLTRQIAGVNAEVRHDSDTCPERLCFLHENTEDLEALLSSDEDEVSSTGHSPSDVTGNNSLTGSSSHSDGYSICKRKRQRDNEAPMDDDTSSTASSGMKTAIAFQKVSVAASIHSIHGLVKNPPAFQETALPKIVRNDLTGCNMFFPDDISSSSSANKKVDMLHHQQHQEQEQQLRVEVSRKEKIKSILRLLRGIIPGGESKDTAFVLDEAIQYVRILQSEVQKLQARKCMGIPKHQQK